MATMASAQQAVSAALCKGGTVLHSGCRHCRAIAQQQVSTAVVVAVPQQVITGGLMLLPPGWWPIQVYHHGSQATGAGGALRGIDPNRFRFLKGLQVTPGSVVIMPALGQQRRDPYVGFVVQAGSGRSVALVECPREDNALYIFRADTTRWQSIATQSKWDVLHSGHPDFVCRVFHTGNWQQRVRQILARL